MWRNLFSGQAIEVSGKFPQGGGRNSALLGLVDGSAIECVYTMGEDTLELAQRIYRRDNSVWSPAGDRHVGE